MQNLSYGRKWFICMKEHIYIYSDMNVFAQRLVLTQKKKATRIMYEKSCLQKSVNVPIVKGNK